MAGEKPKSRPGKQPKTTTVSNADERYVVYAKYKDRIINKAIEMEDLCDAEVAVLMVSPDGRPYSFGNPSAESVVARFRAANIEGENMGDIEDRKKLNELKARIDEELLRRKELERENRK